MKINSLIQTDIDAALGNHAGALRGLWADVAQQQSDCLNPQVVASFVWPESYKKVRERVTLKRTFNQKWSNGVVTKFWRVTGPIGHKNLNSDLSLEGLREWGIL